MSKITTTITSVEASILVAYCRTNRRGARACTVASGWNTTTGNVSNIDGSSVKVIASELVGKHLLRSSVARRITANTAGSTTALTCTAFATAPTAGAATIQDGFTQCPDSQVLRMQPMDRWFQMVLGEPVRDVAFGVKGQGRFTLPFEIEVAYQMDADPQAASVRWAEDAEAITNILQDDAHQPSGVTLFPAGAPRIAEMHAPPEGGQPEWFIGSVPFTAVFTDTSVES